LEEHQEEKEEKETEKRKERYLKKKCPMCADPCDWFKKNAQNVQLSTAEKSNRESNNMSDRQVETERDREIPIPMS
jgi:hypothetical protein